jgi:hypothetical protein
MESKAEMVIAIKGYKCEKREELDDSIDFTVLDAKSDDKILLRVITELKSKSGVVGIDTVRTMIEYMKHEDCDKGVLIGERFSKAAKREMEQESIEKVSMQYMPMFKLQKLYLTIRDYVDDLCKARCGRVPEKESDCKGYSEGCYSCKIRLISDDASFHFERGWRELLQDDLIKLLTLRKSMDRQSSGAMKNVKGGNQASA